MNKGQRVRENNMSEKEFNEFKKRFAYEEKQEIKMKNKIEKKKQNKGDKQ